MILICISLMVSDAAHFPMDSLAIFTSSLEKYLLRASAKFLDELFILLLFSGISSYIFWILAPYVNTMACKIFSPISQVPVCVIFYHAVQTAPFF